MTIRAGDMEPGDLVSFNLVGERITQSGWLFLGRVDYTFIFWTPDGHPKSLHQNWVRDVRVFARIGYDRDNPRPMRVE